MMVSFWYPQFISAMFCEFCRVQMSLFNVRVRVALKLSRCHLSPGGVFALAHVVKVSHLVLLFGKSVTGMTVTASAS